MTTRQPPPIWEPEPGPINVTLDRYQGGWYVCVASNGVYESAWCFTKTGAKWWAKRAAKDFTRQNRTEKDQRHTMSIKVGNVDHGYRYEVVIPCDNLTDALQELTDLHVAAEARSFIRESPNNGKTILLTAEEAEIAADAISTLSSQRVRPATTEDRAEWALEEKLRTTAQNL